MSWSHERRPTHEEIMKAVTAYGGIASSVRKYPLNVKLRLLQESCDTFMWAWLAVSDDNKAALQLIHTIQRGLECPNNNKPWSEEDDEAVVQWSASGYSAMELAFQLGRSPASIATRLSYLVGIKRTEFRIDGVIDGDLQGEHVNGAFSGVVRK